MSSYRLMYMYQRVKSHVYVPDHRSIWTIRVHGVHEKDRAQLRLANAKKKHDTVWK